MFRASASMLPATTRHVSVNSAPISGGGAASGRRRPLSASIVVSVGRVAFGCITVMRVRMCARIIFVRHKNKLSAAK